MIPESGKLQILFAQKAKEWADEKVRYRHRGITRRGCDCTGLLIGIANELGYLRNYKLRNYKLDWNLHSGSGTFLIDELEKFGCEIPNNEIGVGDIAVFEFGRCLSHAGIMININSKSFVHIFYEARKCRYGILRNSIWSKRWITTYRLTNEKLSLHN